MSFINQLKSVAKVFGTKGLSDIGKAVSDGFSQSLNPINIANGLLGKYTGSTLTPAEMQNNAFQAAEAQKNRDWQTSMSNTMYQRGVKDMAAAGVNPALVMGGSLATSSPSGGSPSGTAPGQSGSFSDLVAALLAKKQASLLDSQKHNVDVQSGKTAAETRLVQSQTVKTDNENRGVILQNEYQSLLNKYYPGLSEAQISQMSAAAAKSLSDISVNDAQKSFLDAQEGLARMNAAQVKRLADSLVALQSAQAGSAEASAALARAQASWTAFQEEYARKNGSTIPAGGWVALIAYLNERTTTNLRRGANAMEELIDFFTKPKPPGYGRKGGLR